MVEHLPQKFPAVPPQGARPRGRTGTARRATPLIPGEEGVSGGLLDDLMDTAEEWFQR